MITWFESNSQYCVENIHNLYQYDPSCLDWWSGGAYRFVKNLHRTQTQTTSKFLNCDYVTYLIFATKVTCLVIDTQANSFSKYVIKRKGNERQ